MKNEFFNQTFEITFIISLLGFIFAAMNIGNPNKDIPITIILLVLTIGIIHLIIISFVYLFSRGYGYQPFFVELLVKWSQHTLIFLVYSFIHLIFMWICWVFLVHDLFGLFAPLIPVTIIGISVIIMSNKLENGSKLKLSIIPEKIRVFSEYEDNTFLTIIIDNQSKKKKHIKFEMDIPKLVICDINNTSNLEHFVDEFDIEKEKRKIYKVQFKHNNPDYDSEFLEVKISDNSGYIKEKATLKIMQKS